MTALSRATAPCCDCDCVCGQDLLNTPCLTPDCGAAICRIVTIDANGLEKHEIVSDELKRQQQKQPQKQLSKWVAAPGGQLDVV